MPSLSTPPAADEVTIASDLLGTLVLPVTELLVFPAGIPGFPEARRFVLVPAGRTGLYWLQSAEASGLVFLLADPFLWFPDYDIDVPDAELAALGVRAPGDLAVFAVVTLPATAGEPASVNLRAPVLLGTPTRRGRQLVLADERYAVREPLALG